jgi:uncharacterized protein YjiS (DUF1127 family)
MNLFSSLFRRSEKRRNYASLLQLDDHMLRDIGLNRADVHRMMAGVRSTSHTRGHRTHE